MAGLKLEGHEFTRAKLTLINTGFSRGGKNLIWDGTLIT